jgi:large subunit ribosomal protein L19e
MSVTSVKRMAASMLKVGVTRVKVTDPKAADEALTRDDVRNLIGSGSVVKLQKKGVSSRHSGRILVQKRKRRRSGHGNRKGTKKARTPQKRRWITSVRAMRRMLRELKADGRIERKAYTMFYVRVKGGEFRNKKHLLLYLKDRDLLSKAARPPKGGKGSGAGSRAVPGSEGEAA